MGQEGLLLTSVGRELEISRGLEICWAIAWSVSATSIVSLVNYNYLSNAALQEVRLLSCKTWKEGLRTMSIPCLALTGRHSQLSWVHDDTPKAAHFADVFLPPLSMCRRSSGTVFADSLMQEDHTPTSFGVPNSTRLQVKWLLHSSNWTYRGALM